MCPGPNANAFAREDGDKPAFSGLSCERYDRRGEPIAVESPMTSTIPAGTDSHLLATGVDPDGSVQSVSIYGSVTKLCSSGDIGVAQFWDPMATFFEDPAVGVGDAAKDRRFVATLVPCPSYYTCPSGSLDYAVGTFQAVARNFHGGNASSPQLTLRAP